MTQYPQKLQERIEDFTFITTRTERQEYLIQIADQFADVQVSEEIASKPYDESHRVPACESDAFVWWQEREDGTLDFYFDVLNPQGLSAMAVSVILGEACNGADLEQVAAIQSDIIFEFFGKDISMGKGQGLMGIVNMVTTAARNQLKAS
jgi:cysteine desulfuration protein SufE